MVEIDDDYRDRGILTPANRRYLRGEKDLTEGSEVNARVRIRNRIKHSLADFELLVHNLSPKDRRQLFKADRHSAREEHLADGIVTKDADHGVGMLEKVVIFVYMVCRDWGLDFEALVERAVKHAETSVWFDGQIEQRKGVVDAEVTIELLRDSEVDVERAKERFEAGEYLSLPEIGALVRDGLIDGEDLKQFQDEEWSMAMPDETPRNE